MLTDLHVHSPASLDCKEPAANTLQAAIDRGIEVLCFTDHLDLIWPEHPGKKMEEGITIWENSYAIIEEAKKTFGDRIEILHGMELAESPQDPERAKLAAALPGVDFILGSIHALPERLDFYLIDTFGDLEACHRTAIDYIEENIRVAELGCFDALGHFGFYNRYMARHGVYVDVLDYEERVRHLFKILIENGKGIEVNTSGLRQALEESLPNLSVLKLFRECGGEIVTTGSDAHRAKHVGLHMAEAQELLREAGFRYTTIFRQRKPEFIKL
ncbi:MAG: histidinol-phosphatase HisJ family protein [Oscillospiraceae bacterium]|nr:histidinol-phosphatase HisJ family protein [Oscillospiraceae bacterium]